MLVVFDCKTCGLIYRRGQKIRVKQFPHPLFWYILLFLLPGAAAGLIFDGGLIAREGATWMLVLRQKVWRLETNNEHVGRKARTT